MILLPNRKVNRMKIQLSRTDLEAAIHCYLRKRGISDLTEASTRIGSGGTAIVELDKSNEEPVKAAVSSDGSEEELHTGFGSTPPLPGFEPAGS